MKKKIYWILVAIFLIVWMTGCESMYYQGCQSYPETSNTTHLIESKTQETDRIMASWVGHHQSELIANWGPPQKTASDGKGGTILIYEFRRVPPPPPPPSLSTSSPLAGAALAPGDYSRIQAEARRNALSLYSRQRTIDYIAQRMFYVNEGGIIYHCRWSGL